MKVPTGSFVRLKAWKDADPNGTVAPEETVLVLDGPHNGVYFCRDDDFDYLDVPEDQVLDCKELQ